MDYLVTQTAGAHTGLVGGNALYAAVGAALWEPDVGVWARVGRNYPLSRLNGLSHHGVSLDGLIHLAEEQDHRTFYAYTPDGSRVDVDPAVHFARAGAPVPAELAGYVDSTPRQADPAAFEPLALRAGDWPPAYDGAAILHLAPLPLASHLNAVATLRERGVRCVTCDPGERYMIPELAPLVRRLVSRVDAFLPSASEVRTLLGPGVDLWDAADIFREWGAGVVVIKNGADGVMLIHGTPPRQTSLSAYHPRDDDRVIDVTGAGDAFCGGFAAGLARGADPVTSARMGMASASLVIEGYGALYALSRASEGPGRVDELIQIPAAPVRPDNTLD